jgi:hypothetical protein
MKKTLEETCEPCERNCAVFPGARGSDDRYEKTCPTVTWQVVRRQR